MNDWKIGDLALCIKSGRVTRTGSIYTVSDMLLKQPGERLRNPDGSRRYLTSPVLLLRFEGVKPVRKNSWSNSDRFVKVTPEDEDGFDKEIIDKMKEKTNENVS